MAVGPLIFCWTHTQLTVCRGSTATKIGDQGNSPRNTWQYKGLPTIHAWKHWAVAVPSGLTWPWVKIPYREPQMGGAPKTPKWDPKTVLTTTATRLPGSSRFLPRGGSKPSWRACRGACAQREPAVAAAQRRHARRAVGGP